VACRKGKGKVTKERWCVGKPLGMRSWVQILVYYRQLLGNIGVRLGQAGDIVVKIPFSFEFIFGTKGNRRTIYIRLQYQSKNTPLAFSLFTHRSDLITHFSPSATSRPSC